MLDRWIAKALGEDSARLALMKFEWENGKPKRIDKLSNYVELASLYADDGLVEKVVLQALEKGANYIVHRVSPEAEEFMRRYRAVHKEFSRLKRSTRLQEVGKMLVAEVETRFPLEMKLARHFRAKYRQEIVVLSQDKAYMLNGQSYIMDRQDFVERSGYEPSRAWRDQRMAQRSRTRTPGQLAGFGAGPTQLTDFF